MNVAQAGDLVMLITSKGKRFLVSLEPGAQFHTHRGVVLHDDLLGQPLGRQVKSQLGEVFLALEPSTADLIKEIERSTQIVYPKEAAQIILRMNIYPGRRVIEAGSGSGGLTLALARALGPGGRVYSYEARPEMQLKARRNLERVGLAGVVEFKLRHIGQGFDETDADALFLDVREPWRFLEQARAALKGGGFFGALVPTTNQISRLVAALEGHHFGDLEVEEVLIRRYKPVPDRIRPEDRLTMHTGYLIFARCILPGHALAAKPRKRVRVVEAMEAGESEPPAGRESAP
ncbi:MAG: tRNA (adenine-N1)-methyltransferase [Anaerolineae bacterium]